VQVLTSSVQSVTSIERAHAAHELTQRQQSAAAKLRRSRVRSRRLRVAVISTGVVVLAMGLTVYTGWLSTVLRSASVVREASHGGFNETHTGRVRTVIGGNTCQELQFNNDRGVFVGGSVVSCVDDTIKEGGSRISNGTRLKSISKAFRR
jgi:hypothetical protein